MAFVLDVAGDNEALVARNAAGITDVAGLRGKRVATAFASTAHYSLLAALQQAGLSASDVQLIDLQPQASLAAWERGDVDAVYTWLPTLDELRKNGTHLIASRELATAGKPTLDLGVVSTAFAQDAPRGRRHLAQGRDPGADADPRRPGRGRRGDRAGDRSPPPRTPRTSSSRACT